MGTYVCVYVHMRMHVFVECVLYVLYLICMGSVLRKPANLF